MQRCRDIEDAYYSVLWRCMRRSFSFEESVAEHPNCTVGDIPYLQLVTEGSFIGKYRMQMPALDLEIHHPVNHRPFIPTPEGKPHLAVCDDKYIEEEYINYLMGNKKAENEAYTYGERINASIWLHEGGSVSGCRIGWRKTTQLAQVIEKLNKNRGTNQACIAIERPEDIVLADPPCLRLIDFKVVNGKLNMGIYFRSWDAYAGLPVNLAGLQLMKEAIAIITGLKAGVTFAYSSGVHVYQQDWPLACERIGYDYERWLKGVEEQFKIKLGE